MIPSWLQAVLALIAPAGFVTAWATIAASKRLQHTSLLLADKQFDYQRTVELDKIRQSKKDEAYAELMVWLDDMVTVIDTIWDHLCQQPAAERLKAKKLLEDWPWKTLRPHREAARLRHYWSSRILEYVGSLGGASSDFFTHAGIVATGWKQDEGELVDDEHVRMVEQRTKVWQDRSTMLGIMDKIREAAKTDLMTNESQDPWRI